jgi:hypothetical protein
MNSSNNQSIVSSMNDGNNTSPTGAASVSAASALCPPYPAAPARNPSCLIHHGRNRLGGLLSIHRTPGISKEDQRLKLYKLVHDTMKRNDHFHDFQSGIFEKILESKASYRMLANSNEYTRDIILADGVEKYDTFKGNLPDFFGREFFEKPDNIKLSSIRIENWIIELSDCFFDVSTCCFYEELPNGVGCSTLSSKNYTNLFVVMKNNRSELLELCRDLYADYGSNKCLPRQIIDKICAVDYTIKNVIESLFCAINTSATNKSRFMKQGPAVLFMLSVAAKNDIGFCQPGNNDKNSHFIQPIRFEKYDRIFENKNIDYGNPVRSIL